MNPANIKHLVQSDLENPVKVAIVANYFDSLCDSEEVLDLIQHRSTNTDVIHEILKSFSCVPFYGRNPKLSDTLCRIFLDRGQYRTDHLNEVILSMGLQDLTFIYDILVKSPQDYVDTISDRLYGSNVEYLAQLISNESARLMPTIESLASCAQLSSGPKNFAYLMLIDICYVFSKEIVAKMPVEIVKAISSLERLVKAGGTFEEYLRRLRSAFPGVLVHYYDYNSSFGTIYERYRPTVSFPFKEGSIEIEGISALKRVLVGNTPLTSLMVTTEELSQMKSVMQVGSTEHFHIIPCLYGGVPKGLLVVEMDKTHIMELPCLIGIVVAGKDLARFVQTNAEQVSAMRYYHDFVQHHEFAVRSLIHEVSHALGRMVDATVYLRKRPNLSRDDLDEISEVEESREIIDNAVQSMKAYTDTLIIEKAINSVIDNVIRNLKTYLKREKIELAFCKDPYDGRIVSGPSINMILTNVIVNGVKATERNTSARKIMVSAVSSEDNVTITVADNGCGVDPILRDTVFNENVTTWGNGIGLTIVRGLLTEMGGEIKIGKPTTGAEFVISLPKVRSNV